MRILRLSLNLHTPLVEFSSTQNLLKSYGENLGNLAFVYACSTIFDGRQTVWTDAVAQGATKDDFDLVLFPAANNLSPTSDLGWLANVMEQFPLPTLIVGLGVQAPLDSPSFDLPSGSARFIELLKARNLPVGVRGEDTKAYLATHGVTNVVVTGCPSNFLNPRTDLGRVLEPKYAAMTETQLQTIALNLEYFRLAASDTQRLIKWFGKRGGGVILQSDYRLISLVRGDDAGVDKDFIKYAAKYFLGTTDVDLFRRWLRSNCRIFVQTASWIDYLRSCSFSTGTRFHGNMLALQAETPALVLYHDQRTREMADTMKLPSRPWSAFDEETFDQQICSIPFSGEDYDRQRSILAARTVELAREVGFTMAPHVLQIAAKSR